MLTHKDKEEIIYDYKMWSNGFTPDEMSPEDNKLYVENGMRVKYVAMGDYILHWLNNFKSENFSATDHTKDCSSDTAVNREAEEWIKQVAWQDDVIFSDVEKRYMLYAWRAGAFWGKHKKETK